ncbi:hypothetical protein J7T55_005213 [Diaporthe amygdali]|uniref:uncharacterized protein n=1 Tax=Phomopsis amygdali TaxID=1214568 RepID=UPI0022FE642F|nr:uncharacterized protein J7T55_005213 [Diaporthe amygdali]KAJ0116267.1 hypothetical protein J7T55_005213 [Diaporthe amygdali]
MMVPSLPLSIILFTLSSTTAIQVTPGSSCSSVCLDSPDGDSMRAAASTTNASDIVCNDVDYFSSAPGLRFKDCVTCLQTSNAISGEESDVSWFLYNLRYASAVCLFDYPAHKKTTTTPCDLASACAPLQDSLEYGNLDPENATEYGYCQANDGVLYGTNIDDCVTCLQSSSSTYLANFLRALGVGCQERPSPGAALSITGNIFSAFPINTTNASNTTSASAAGSDGDDKQVLTTGAIAGIALGATALFLGAIALFVLYWLKQKKYEREDNAPSLPPFASAQQFYHCKGDPGSGPVSIATSHSYALPQYAADYKPQPGVSAASVSETPEPLPSEYSSNAEYYDRLEGKTRGRPLRAMSPPVQPVDSQQQQQQEQEQVDTIGNLPTTALPTHPAYIPRTSSRNSNNRGTPDLGARPSRNPTPCSVRSSTQSPVPRPQRSSGGASKSSSGSARPDSYAIQVYLNAAEDPKVPRPPPAAAASSLLPLRCGPASNAEIARNIQIELAAAHQATPQPTPPLLSASSMPVPSSQSQQQHSISRATSPDNNSNDDHRGSLPPPPRIGSLILPSVPRIRVPGKKPLPRIQVQQDGASISGPLVFPGSRFSTRAPPPPPPPPPPAGQDRIIEQTVNRGGRSFEAPIGSGKSYLYG